MTPDDIQYLLETIIQITRGVNELTNLTTNFQTRPFKELLRSLMQKDIEIEYLLRNFENKLDDIEECELE
jgi:hypothetical protein